MSRKVKYVIITPARNEQCYIWQTISSVVYQKFLPTEWVIVDDGSTDSTSIILRRASVKYPWIKVISKKNNGSHNYRSVVEAIELGFSKITVLDYDYVALLDADIVLPSNYFSSLIMRMEADPCIGLAGGIVAEPGELIPKPPRNMTDVPGAVQTFRKECFLKVKPLVPIAEGGWDAITCAKARMEGYRTVLFLDLIAQHLKFRSSYEKSELKRLWAMGVRDWALGYCVLFEIAKCTSRIANNPKIIGSVVWLAGYFHSLLTKRECIVPMGVKNYMRKEQRNRIFRAFRLTR